MRCARLRSVIVSCAVIASSGIVGVGSARAAIPGETLWAKRFSADITDAGLAIAASPDGTTLFVTGYSGGNGQTIAYNAATGAKLWDVAYDGLADFGAGLNAVAVSPEGSKVFVAGYAVGATSGADYATVAYDASSGAELWDKTYAGPQTSDVFDDFIHDIAVTPAGTVVVTGQSAGGTDLDYATIAYAGSTGARLWIKRFDGPASGDDIAFALAESPDGSRVFVTGRSRSLTFDYTTIAYASSTGTRVWRKRYDGPGHFDDSAFAIAVAPDSSAVFVTGGSGQTTSDFGTVAYDASTGALLWAKLYDGRANGGDSAYSVGTSPDGKAVFVTGGTEEGFATVAYDAETAARLWARNGLVGGLARALAVSPNGGEVVVTGGDSPNFADRDYLTVSYDQSTGAKLWSRRYDGPANYQDNVSSIAFASDGSSVFVTGQSRGLMGDDFATVAYSA